MKRRSSQFFAILFGAVYSLSQSEGVPAAQHTAREGDAYTILPCDYNKPTHPFKQVTIEWIKESPDVVLGPTLVQLVDFEIQGIADRRYGATPKGELVIQNVSLSDEGSYRCMIIFRLETPIDDNGYITLHHAVELTVIGTTISLAMYPKSEGPDAKTDSKIKLTSDNNETIVCTTSSTERVALEWSLDNRRLDDNITTTYQEEGDASRRMVTSISELTVSHHSGKSWCAVGKTYRPASTVSCTAILNGEEVITESKELTSKSASKKGKRRRKGKKSRDGRKNRRRSRRNKKVRKVDRMRKRQRPEISKVDRMRKRYRNE
ncbi:uncharacterized protein [Ptychodera flava]|uniref:uncharacterized protein n=1 Tax=Ptychodera flava TaxID=63121 RepID=UPI00396A2BFD